MIKPPSIQSDYTLVYSGDPSLALPTGEREREKALEVARETGQWAALIIDRESPTLFHVRPIFGRTLDWMISEIRRRQMSGAESAVLALKLGLRSVEGFGDHRVDFEHVEGHQIATDKIIDALYAIDGVGRDIVQELGGVVLARALDGLRPKS